MRKKLLSAVLALTMTVSAIPSALAAKKDYSSESALANIYEWGGFDDEEAFQLVTYNSGKGNLETAGAKSGRGCAKVVTTHDYGSIQIPAPLVVGETYDISFDVKTDDAPSTMSLIFTFDDGGYYFISRAGSFNKEWTHFETSWTNTGINAANVQTSGKGKFSIRYGTGLERITYYLDNFSVTPRGDVPADYSSLKIASKTTEEQKPNLVSEPKEVMQVSFSDMKNHWAEDTVNTLATYGYLEGVGENRYDPYSDVTRAQFVKMIVDTYHLILPEYSSSFSDISGNEWFAGYVTAADKLGLLDPVFTAGSLFRPDQPITREEAASVAARTAAYKNAGKKADFSAFADDNAVSAWAKQAVKDAADYGLIKGYEDGSFQPLNHISRAEAAQILMRVAEISTRFNIYVDAQIGDDKQDGTKEAPLKTIYAAQKLVRKFNQNMTNDIQVFLKGTHYLDKTLELTNADSGSNGYSVIYTSWGEEKPLLTMGERFTGFTLHDAEKNIYRVYVGKGVQTRQAYFNGLKGIRARSICSLTNPEYLENAYYESDDTQLLNFEYPKEVELVYHQQWTNGRVMIDEVEDLGGGRVKVVPNRECFSTISDFINRRSIKDDSKFPSYLENAYELLDIPNEWYMNEHDGYMYYIPAPGEDMSTMELTVPVGEQMITAKGSSAKEPIHHITFDNIEFADTGWLAPTKDRYVRSAQNNMYSGNSILSVLPGSAVAVENAHYVNFINSKFTRMGIIALTLEKAIKYCNVIGNEFFDIAGSAVFLGSPADPYLPSDPDEYNEYNKVNNNYIHEIATDYQGSAAISTGYPRHSEINHNEIANTSYTGIHVGWGWALHADTGTAIYDLELGYNYIHEIQVDRIYDGGGIYTVCASSFESAENNNRIVGNYFENIRNAYASVYPDEGSTYWHIYNNVTDMRDVPKWEYNFASETSCDEFYWFMIHTGSIMYNTLENNYSTHPKIRYNSDNNVIRETYGYPDAEWPEEAQNIVDQAGIEPEYQKNFDLTGQRSFVARTRGYTVGKNETAKLDVKVLGSHLEEYPISDYDIQYYVSDPSLLTVDQDGTMRATGNGTGIVWVMAVADMGGRLQTKQFRVVAGDDVETLELNANALNMISGYTAKISAVAKTSSGQRLSISSDCMTFSSDDPSVVTVSENGTVTAVGAGTANIHVTAEYKGVTLEQDISVKIITYTQEDSLSLPYENAPAKFFTPSAWRGGGTASGNALSVSGSPNFFTAEPIKNKLIAFDMSINNPNSWPSLTLCAHDITMGSYQTDSTYLIGFKKEFIEMQRFNNGVRTMIFGDAEYTPVGGPGIPNVEGSKIFEYGKTYSVIVGALDEAEGTRIVLTINGKNVFDYLDTDENAIPSDGYIGIYNSGDFTFSPYTGRTE